MQFGNSQGQVFLGRDIGHEQNYSDAIAYEIDQEMQSIITSCYERTKTLLSEKSKEMHLIAQTLLSEETLEMDQIKSLIENGTLKSEGEGGDSSEHVEIEPNTEPIIETVGDVKVRIQTRDQEETPPVDLNKGESSDDPDKK
ncbi:ATP-dependent zinc metalloprotease FtsH [compost metagenome]